MWELLKKRSVINQRKAILITLSNFLVKLLNEGVLNQVKVHILTINSATERNGLLIIIIYID